MGLPFTKKVALSLMIEVEELWHSGQVPEEDLYYAEEVREELMKYSKGNYSYEESQTLYEEVNRFILKLKAEEA
jgi:hypothetical protein